MTELQIPVKAISRSEMAVLVPQLKEQLLETNSALEAYVKLYNLRELVMDLMEELKEGALGNMIARTDNVYGAVVEVRNKAKVYDYGDDPHLKGLMKLLEDAKKAVDAWKCIRQLQTSEIIEGSTGEILKPPRVVEAGDTLAVTLPK